MINEEEEENKIKEIADDVLKLGAKVTVTYIDRKLDGIIKSIRTSRDEHGQYTYECRIDTYQYGNIWMQIS